MDERELGWLLGFFESQASFTVNIGLPKSKNRRYVAFKSYVVIANTDKYQVEYVRQLLNLTHANINPKKKKEEVHNKTFSLNIQNFDDIDKVLELLSTQPLKSKSKQDRLDRFKICYTHIKKVGAIHQSWNDEFEEIINEKLNINKERSNINKNRFSAEEWITKIKEHLRTI